MEEAWAMVAISLAPNMPPHFMSLILNIPYGASVEASVSAACAFFKLSSAASFFRSD